MTLKEIKKLLDAELYGDENIIIEGLSDIESPLTKTITFAASKKYYKLLNNSCVSAVIVPEKIETINIPQLIVKNPYIAFLFY